MRTCTGTEFPADPYELAAEMYRAEFAVAVAGAVLGIQPFDQPNVEAAKVFAREAMAAREPVLPSGDLEVVGAAAGATRYHELLAAAQAGDYVALQAYLPASDPLNAQMQAIRSGVGERTLASTSGIGPRYLHSTGQLHKGGPNDGIFVQIVDEDRPEVPVPETNFSFGDVVDAQALGDAQALADRGRRLVRVTIDHVGELESFVS